MRDLYRIHLYSPLRPDGAFCLTDAATDTKMLVYIRPQDLLSVNYGFFQLYRFIRYRAMFFAHYAILLFLPRQAQRPVDARKSQTRPQFLPLRKAADSSRGTNVAAQRAMIFTIPYLRNKMRRPDALKPRLQKSRLQAVGDADFHAITAAHATVNEFAFGQRGRRTYDPLFRFLP